MSRILIEENLLHRAVKYCSDEKTKSELENLLDKVYLENIDLATLRQGDFVTTTLPVSRKWWG